MRSGSEGLEDRRSGRRSRRKSEGKAGMFESCDGLFEILPAISQSRSNSSGHRTDLFGFELLTYSYAPTGWPTPFCAKVVERDIYFIERTSKKVKQASLTDSITAPVTGSCGLPAWTANVPNL